jgi:hypothetical protein
MGEPDDKYTPTPEQIAAVEKLEPLSGLYTPEQLAVMQKVLAKHSPEEIAKLDRMTQRLDRYLAIRDGQIRPPWMEQTEPKPEPPLAETLEPVSEPESAAELEPELPEPKKRKPKDRRKEADVADLIQTRFKEGVPPNTTTAEVLRKIGLDTSSRDTVNRVLGRRPVK